MNPREQLAAVLRETRGLIARSADGFGGSDFDLSGWESRDAALADIDSKIAAVESGRLPPEGELSVLFAPTGAIQEVSISGGWAEEFMVLADQFDAALERAYS